MPLLVIGTLAYDNVETQNDKREDLLGGSAMYCAVAASLMRKPGDPGPRLVGVVGEDFRKFDLEALQGLGIDTEGVEVAPGRTFRWGGRYEPDWNTRHTTFTELNVLEHFDPKVPEAYRDSRFVFLANAHPAVQERALDQVHGKPFVVADTMNLWIDVALDDLKHLLKRVDGLILNDEEARLLTGKSNLIQAAHQVLELGPRYVILKKGEHGAFLMGEDVHFSLPAYPITEVIDPTGAGDCFAGGFMGSLVRDGDVSPAALRRAMLFGTVTASFCVQGFSIETLIPRTADHLQARYEELASICTI
ncbi:MAG: sugar kinase [Planctomycetes bacterium]|nr:sugar kinase [Planctomycetota bacterium]MCB9910458.1 sugar kinase [Planctomycetota bacterium]MCB9912584.1 sugar kinase [Planctomycetota bacterium]